MKNDIFDDDDIISLDKSENDNETFNEYGNNYKEPIKHFKGTFNWDDELIPTVSTQPSLTKCKTIRAEK